MLFSDLNLKTTSRCPLASTSSCNSPTITSPSIPQSIRYPSRFWMLRKRSPWRFSWWNNCLRSGLAGMIVCFPLASISLWILSLAARRRLVVSSSRSALPKTTFKVVSVRGMWYILGLRNGQWWEPLFSILGIINIGPKGGGNWSYWLVRSRQWRMSFELFLVPELTRSAGGPGDSKGEDQANGKINGKSSTNRRVYITNPEWICGRKTRAETRSKNWRRRIESTYNRRCRWKS